MKKRQFGSGSIVREKHGLAIRWPEYILLETGARKRKMCYEFLGLVSEREASKTLTDRIAQARRDPPKAFNAPVTFQEHAARWQRDMLDSAGDGSADLYKYSVRDCRAGILQSRLNPRFGSYALPEISTDLLQEWIAELRREGLAASTIHNYHKALKGILSAAVTWKRLTDNPADGIRLPQLKGKRQKWALTLEQAAALIQEIRPVKPQTMAALAIMSGLRRGELVAARWRSLDEGSLQIVVTEASYRGHLGSPKTEAGVRSVPLDQWLMDLLGQWRRLSRHTRPEDFIFATRTGQQENPNNIARRYIYPACDRLKLKRATWNTFRQTFSTLLHHQTAPARAIADMMGHLKVQTQYIYIQSVDAAKREAATRLGQELSRIAVQKSETNAELVN
jgi:integrase